MPALLAALFALAVNINSLRNDFVLDDESQVQRNVWLQDWRNIPKMFSGNVWSFSGSQATSNYYRPFMHVMYLIIMQTFGMKAWAFHLLNVAVHAFNTILVFLVARLLIRRSGVDENPRMKATPAWMSVPFIASMLFAVHPVHSEAIAWIASLPELSFSLFFLAAYALWLDRTACSGYYVAATAGLYSLALLCKETAVVLPAALLVVDISFPRKAKWKDRLLPYFPLVAITLVYLGIRRAVLAQSAIPALPIQAIGFDRYSRNVLPLFVEYLKLLFAPVKLHFWHSISPLPSFATASGILDLLALLLFVICSVIAWKKDRKWFIGISLFMLPLLPAFHLTAIAGKPFAERYLYLPSAGFVLVVAFFLHYLFTKSELKSLVITTFVILVVFYSAGTVSRNRVWKNLVTLYLDNTAKSPNAPVPCNDLARVLFSENKIDEALNIFEKVNREKRENAACESSLGSALLLKGRFDEAIVHLQAAIAHDPGSLDSINDLAIAFRRTGRTQEAIEQYRKALKLNPDYADAHFNLASTLADTGNVAEALEHYSAAIRLRPTDAYYHAVLGIEYARQNRFDEAIAQFSESVRLKPDEPAYRKDLDRAMVMKKAQTQRPSPK